MNLRAEIAFSQRINSKSPSDRLGIKPIGQCVSSEDQQTCLAVLEENHFFSLSPVGNSKTGMRQNCNVCFMPASFSSPPQKDFIVFDCDGDWRKTPIGINRFKDGPTPFGVGAKGLLALGAPPPLSVPSVGRAVAMRWGVAMGAVHFPGRVQ